MRPHLARLTLRGFRTIRELKDFEPGPITILIGPNGAGKTNFISFFSLLSWALTPPGGLQVRVAELGGASALLHDGPRQTQIEASLTIQTEAGTNEYEIRLFHAARDIFVFADERFIFRPAHSDSKDMTPKSLGAGHLEPKLIEAAEKGPSQTPKTILGMLRRMIVHQFHDTSANSRIRSKWDVDDSRRLKYDAANLAPDWNSCVRCKQ